MRIRFTLKVKPLNLDHISTYFAGLEALAREARTSTDPRVKFAALDLMKRQPRTIEQLLKVDQSQREAA